VELGPEPHHMPRLVVRADCVQGLVPGGQQLAGGGVEVAAAGLIQGGACGAAGPAPAPGSALGARPAQARPPVVAPLIGSAHSLRSPRAAVAALLALPVSRHPIARCSTPARKRTV